MRKIFAANVALLALVAGAGAPAMSPAQAAPPAQASATEAPHFAQVSGAKLYYEECNATAPISVVLLHDGLLHSVTWDDVWGPLCAKFHVLRYDRRGYGRSDTATAPFVPEEDLFQLMRLAKMDRAIIAGNSSGAGLALDFALAHPDMTEGLFLIGPVVHGMPSSAYFLERGNRANAPLAQNDFKAAAENWSRDPYLISSANPEARKKLLEGLARSPQNLKTGGQFETRPSPPTVLRLAQIQAPALVLIGDADIADVIAYGGAIEAALPIVSFEVWKNCGHLIQLEKPAELVARLQRFAALADRREAVVPAAELREVAGEYKFFNRSIAISLKKDRLWLGLPDTPDKPLFAASNSRFFVRTTETEFQFERDPAGKIVKLVIFNADGNKIECPRA
jgi:pimeloyl-ACP methyl ester carboxylesterase